MSKRGNRKRGSAKKGKRISRHSESRKGQLKKRRGDEGND